METNEKVTISERIEDFLYDHSNKILYGSLLAYYGFTFLLVKKYLDKAIRNGNPINVFTLLPEKKK